MKTIVNIFQIIVHICNLISSQWVETTVTQRISQVHQLELEIKVDTSSVVKTLTIFASLSDSLPRFSRKEGVGVVLWILILICSAYSILHLNQTIYYNKKLVKAAEYPKIQQTWVTNESPSFYLSFFYSQAQLASWESILPTKLLHFSSRNLSLKFNKFTSLLALTS